MTETLRRYGYGTPLLISTFGGNTKRVTVVRAVEDEGVPAFEAVDQQGNMIWGLDTQILEVLE